jgi:hypothetical protein
VRALDIALAALALRTSTTKPPQTVRRLLPALDDADAALLDRDAVPQERAALIASLWPAPTRQCVARPLHLELPAPAVFGRLLRVSWPGAPGADAHAFPGGAAEAAASGKRAA